MAYSSEPSSSISFTSSSHISNGSTNYTIPSTLTNEPRSNLEIISLNKLSLSLEKLLADSGSDLELNYNDAEVVVEGISVGIHRCILATRSKFFSDLFKGNKGCVENNGKPKYIMSDLLPYGNVGYDAFIVFLNYIYTGKLKSFPSEVSTCVDSGCQHDACWPAINFAVELTCASSVFQVPELVTLCQRRLLNFVDKALVEDMIPILVIAFHCQLENVLSRCIDRIARSNLDAISLEKELPFEVAQKIKSLRNNSQDDDEPTVESEGELREKRIRSIHKALDCDDVELVKMILMESEITLDEACALHYVVSYCDQEVAKEVLNLNMGDVNLRNSRGYTVLHVAAMRKEPSIIVSLLNKGACASDTTFDGQTAVIICRRKTRLKDYHGKTEHGKETKKDRLCIDVLEREVKRNPMMGDVSVCSSAVSEDLHMKLLYLENRVAFARLLFPSEAKLAMEIAHAESTSEFPGLLASKGSNGNLREMDLNETPLVQNKRMLSRMEALSRTVEMGRRYFPHCSEVLDKFMEDDLQDLYDLENGTPEEQQLKKTRFVELKEDVQRAFTKDKAELQSNLPSSIYSPTKRNNGAKNKARKLS
ncbi:BTB/POZ domain and ankyrin repeat-containing protein NPR1-like [Rutidosis leptorrhynchoides]|uniref:BTB/POZ domain and ankyrin repeat-containing protein NPR1-like n=1 Tax=Rutidosis leptorrhynchoides TaxID=125765 RepID=UPI003A99C821